MARPIEIHNRVRITLEPSIEYKQKFIRFAKMQGMNQREFFELLIDDFEEGCIICKHCQTPIADPRTIHLDQVVSFQCQKCKKETKYDLTNFCYVE